MISLRSGHGKKKKPGVKNNKYFGAAKGKDLIIIQFESLENAVLFKK